MQQFSLKARYEETERKRRESLTPLGTPSNVVGELLASIAFCRMKQSECNADGAPLLVCCVYAHAMNYLNDRLRAATMQ